MHYLRHEVGLQPLQKSDALRFGSGWARAMEAKRNGATYDTALEAAFLGTELDELQCATLAGLLAAYYETQKTTVVKQWFAEIEFRVPIDGSRTFESAGKMDALAELTDGRLALVEDKTTAESVEPGSDFYTYLSFNNQLFCYVEAARAKGWNVETIIYNVTRKPSIRQKQNETIDDYSKRLREDAITRPEFYFASREVAVLSRDLEAFKLARLQVGRMILDMRGDQKKLAMPEDAWPRTVGKFSCGMGCEFAPYCLQNISMGPDAIPAGFKIEVNPELTKGAV
jgi:hypothetical protein